MLCQETKKAAKTSQHQLRRIQTDGDLHRGNLLGTNSTSTAVLCQSSLGKFHKRGFHVGRHWGSSWTHVDRWRMIVVAQWGLGNWTWARWLLQMRRAGSLSGSLERELFQGLQHLGHVWPVFVLADALQSKDSNLKSSAQRILALQLGVHNPEQFTPVAQVGSCPVHQILLDSNFCFVNSTASWNQFQQHNPIAIDVALGSKSTCSNWASIIRDLKYKH